MKCSKMDYVRRISNSTPVQLVVISYELALDYIEDSKQNLLNNEEEAFSKNMQRAQDSLQALMSNLDMSYNLSWELLSVYLYVSKQLAHAVVSRKTEYLDEAHKLLSKLLTSWIEIEKNEEDKAPVISNSQQVYAGLTYGRGGLDEFVMEDSSRGFKA